MVAGNIFNRLIFILACILFVPTAGNTATDYYFKQISLQEGLSQSTVHCMLKDYKGMIWIGTRFGLNTFDQTEIKSYYHEDNNQFSLPGNLIHFIAEDSLNNLWIGTNGGLAIYNRTTDSFKKVTFNGESIVPVSFHRMPGCILFGESGRIFRFGYSDNKLSVLPMKKNTENISQFDAMSSYTVRSETTGKIEQKLLITCRWNGMWNYNFQTNELDKISYIKEKEISYSYIDSHERFWIAPYGKGLLCYNKKGELLKQFTTGTSGLSNNVVLSMIERNGELWIATDGGGISILNLQNFTFRVIQYISGKPYTLPVNSIYSLYNDNEDYMWAGSIRGGLIGIKEVYINTYTDVPLNTIYGLTDKTATSLFEDAEGIIWAGTDGGGLNRFDPKNNIFKHYPSTYGYKIVSLTSFDNKELVCSVFSKGLYLFNKQSGSFLKMDIWNETETNRIFNSGFTVNINQFDPGKLLILADNIYIYDIQNKKLNTVTSKEPELGGRYLQRYYSDKKVTYLLSGHSILEINHTNKTVSPFYTLPDSLGEITTFCVDKNGRFWIGTEEVGIICYNPLNKKTIKISTQLFKGISSLSADSKGRIWIGAHNLLFAYIPNENKFIIFGESDGVYANEFTGKPALLSRTGDVFIGGVNGLIHIKNSIPFDNFPEPIIKLLNVELDGVSRSLDGKEDHNSISIPWNYSTLTVKVIAHEKDPMRKKVFRYEIRGAKDELYSSQSNRLKLNTLQTGNYKILVSCLSRDGIWSIPVEVLSLKVTAPWWKSLWFILLVLSLIVASAFVVFRIMILRKENKLQWQLKEQEQNIYEEKISFLLNISHELRTPLTLIYAPLKRLLDKNDPNEVFREQLTGIYKQVHKMKNTINMVLDAHKMDSGQNTLILHTLQLNEWIYSIAEDFRMEYQSSNIQLNYDLDPSVGSITYDEVKIEIVLSNLLINALKFSDPGACATISTKKTDSTVRVSVSDEGIGLGNVDSAKLFGRFYQGIHDRSGSGIGLSYAKALIEMHGGAIGAANNYGKGATFYFDLPLANAGKTVSGISNPLMNEFLLKTKDEKNLAIQEAFDFNKYAILIVEDEPDLRTYLKQTLKEYFGQVYVAENGVNALEIITMKHPDIIASDVMMPKMDGFELCKRVKEDIKISHIPIILLTALGGQESSDLGYKLGADVYLSKPFEIDLLLAVAKNLIKGRELIKMRHKETTVLVSPVESTFSNADEKFMISLNNLINDNISNPALDVQFIADNLAMSRASLYNKMKDLMGLGIKDYINKIRLAEAAQLLSYSDLTIMEVSDKTGFSNQQYFSTVFKQTYGMAPSKYRQEQTQSSEEK